MENYTTEDAFNLKSWTKQCWFFKLGLCYVWQ